MTRKLLAVIIPAVLILSLFQLGALADDAPVMSFSAYSEVVEYLSEANKEGDSLPDLELNVVSAVLMEASTGTVLYSVDGDKPLPPASVTKVMTLLLLMEGIESGKITLEDDVTTSEHAASMGGTQLYLEVGEQMSVHELLKAVAVASANDATVALAEHLSGSETEFVRQMNERAAELGAKNTNFTSCTGLFDDEKHYTSSMDLAIMTRELVSHKLIYDYSTIWMDTLRNGGFGLANTNKLLRVYKGMNGMKTGYTKLSKYCFSGTAEREGMTLIAVVMGSPTSVDRFSATAKLLDFGFASFAVAKAQPEAPKPINVNKGVCDSVNVKVDGALCILVGKGQEKFITSEITVAESVDAPIAKGTEVGSLIYMLDGEIILKCPIVTTESVEKASFGDYFCRIFGKLFA